MKKYFVNCEDLESLKKEYKKLAMQYHPDRPTGDLQKMQEINAEYEIMFDILSNRKETFTNKKTTENETSKDYINIINQLINCEGLKIEICGSWIYITGNTYANKEVIKSLGFKWCKNKEAWAMGESSGKHKPWSMDKIRNTYGSEIYESKGSFALA